ncbi:MAG: septum formation protein Maf [Bdellovibrionales bacterium]|nr:septum formation protein Maf [Bdellovibrionales bacterium]
MDNRIILASGSPRRKQLLRMSGVSVRVHQPDVNEDILPGERPDAMVKRLAEEKARTVLKRLKLKKEPQIVLAADTTVVNATGRILGKPSSRKEAVKMLRSLQGKDHHVFTGYAILIGTSEKLFRSKFRVVKTRVRIRKMTLREIVDYVDLGESFDKAGAYAAQGFGMSIIENIHGSYTNVVGLPMAQVLMDLRNFGWDP